MPTNISDISIHALVKRATIDDYAAHGDYDISIHALVKRATVGKTVSDSKHTISIHALVKRATYEVLCKTSAKLFQSTPS